VIAAVLFIGALGGGAAAFFFATGDSDAAGTDASDDDVAKTDPPSASEPDTDKQAATADPQAGTDKTNANAKPLEPVVPRTLDEVTWTTETDTTLEELKVTWGIPKTVLTQLNPKLPRAIPTGTTLVVHAASLGASISIGPPNDGRLLRGVPLPQDDAWRLPDDRSRAFGTLETIKSITAAMDAYAQRFADAEPIQVGDLSRRKGGQISGHQSHQSGIDVDVRLVVDESGEGFDAERNWFLVKTLVDGGDIRAIFLNRTEQAWLREAAVADIGETAVDEYFALISHEPGHTYHMHVRFMCAKQDKRCVGFSQPDAGEHDTKRLKKLPPRLPGGTKSGRSKIRLPKRRG